MSSAVLDRRSNSQPRTRAEFLGQPRGLSVLFFTEMWERFSYYGMRAILLLFMTAPAAEGGLGWDVAKAGPVYGLYTAMVYLTSLPGGWLADRFIGQRRAVLIGGVLIMLGHVSLIFRGLSPLYGGLVLIVIGTGLLKPNISTMVGGLYTPEDGRRDSGFSLFYMGINVGAFAAPLVTGFLAQGAVWRRVLTSHGMNPAESWHWGFGAAAVGMFLGLVQYVRGGRHLGTAGQALDAAADPVRRAHDRRSLRTGLLVAGGLAVAFLSLRAAGTVHVSLDGITRFVRLLMLALPPVYLAALLLQKEWTRVERGRLAAIALFFLFAVIFSSAFEQGGSTLALFAQRNTRSSVFGRDFPPAWFQSVNSLFILTLAPCFAWLWPRLGRREPGTPAKFAYGLLFLSGGFLLMTIGAAVSGPGNGRIGPL